MVAAWSWITFWLVVHIVGVLLAFGPSFAYPFFGALVAKQPQHAKFFVEGSETVSKRLTLPIGVIVAVAGVGLIYSLHIPLWSTPWLIVAIVLYAAAYLYGLLVQLPTGMKLFKALDAMPPGPPPPGAGGPPPEIQAMAAKLRYGGMYLSGSVVVIAILMIWQPGKHVFG
ncbi:MAG TPA: DUF2269 family protein [Actinomycetota bacterium]|jgi:hypothetical protein